MSKLLRRPKRPAKKEKEICPTAFFTGLNPFARRCFSTCTASVNHVFRGLLIIIIIMVFLCGCMETAGGYHTTHYQTPFLKMSNFADENAVLLPGRIPGFKVEDIRLLSSSDTKMHVWNAFTRICKESTKQAVSYTKFINLWKQFHPNLVVAKPMADLCFTCQQNTYKLLRGANLPEEEKSECVQTQQAQAHR